MTALKELRIEKKMTQQQVANLVGISLRSYKTYENEEDKRAMWIFRNYWKCWNSDKKDKYWHICRYLSFFLCYPIIRRAQCST